MRLSILICLLCVNAYGQLKKGQIDPSKVPVPRQHYLTEYTFDTSTDPAIWIRQKGLHVSFGSTDELYLRTEVPLDNQLTAWDETGWRGERLNSQVLIWSEDTISQIRFLIKNLTDGKGHSIAKENIKLNLVRYVLSNYPYGASNAACDAGATDTAYLMPDRLEPMDRFDLPGRTVRPVWLSVEIPEGATPGNYYSTIEIVSQKEKTSLTMNIRVQAKILPKPGQWKFRLDLWQNPWVVASYYHVEPWSDEHKLLLKKHLKLYAEAGGKYITTYAVHSPWSDNSYSLEGTMIDWLKRNDGSWKFDYSVFDQYVQLAMDVGIREAITIYTPVPWGYRFRYREESSGNYVYDEWSPESVKFKEVWNIFLDDLKSHLEMKGWFEKTYLGINENPLNITLAAARVIKEHSKSWKITYAGDWHPELSGVLDDYSPVISSEPLPVELKQRQAHGFTTTFYVCCTPPRPNNFVFSPPVESRFIGWYSAAYGYDGFLRWAYDAWPADPMRDSRHTFWPGGDCFMVYPGGNSSIRFEKLREGIVDFEKIRILRKMATNSTDKRIQTMWKSLESHLTGFIDNHQYDKRNYDKAKLTRLLQTGRKMVNELSDSSEKGGSEK